MVVSNAVTNGNPVHGQSNMEASGGCVRGASMVCAHLCGVSVLGCTSRCVLRVVESVSVNITQCVWVSV